MVTPGIARKSGHSLQLRTKFERVSWIRNSPAFWLRRRVPGSELYVPPKKAPASGASRGVKTRAGR